MGGLQDANRGLAHPLCKFTLDIGANVPGKHDRHVAHA